MIVEDDETRSILEKGFFEEGAGFNSCALEGSSKDLAFAEKPLANVEEERSRLTS